MPIVEIMECDFCGSKQAKEYADFHIIKHVGESSWNIERWKGERKAVLCFTCTSLLNYVGRANQKQKAKILQTIRDEIFPEDKTKCPTNTTQK